MPKPIIAKTRCLDPEKIEHDERRKDFETKLRDIFRNVSLKLPEENAFVTCRHCGDAFQEEYTELTGTCCPDCYREVVFMDIPEISTTVGAGTRFSFNTIDDTPSLHNARRAAEEKN